MANTKEATLGNDSITWNRENIEQISGKTVLVIEPLVVLVDPKENKHLRDIVAVLIKYNYLENSILADESHGDAIIKLLGPAVNQLSACFTFDEYCIHLTSIVCQKLGFVGVKPDVALMVQSKQLTYDALRKKSRDFNTNQYSPLSFQIKNVSDISNTKGLLYPAILKPEYGNFSEGVSNVYSIDDCVSKFKMLQCTFEKNWDGGGFGSSMVLMEFCQPVFMPMTEPISPAKYYQHSSRPATYPFSDCDKQYPSQMLSYSHMHQMMTKNSTEQPVKEAMETMREEFKKPVFKPMTEPISPAKYYQHSSRPATYPFSDCDKQYPSQMLSYSNMQQMMTKNSTEQPGGLPIPVIVGQTRKKHECLRFRNTFLKRFTVGREKTK
ncbi:unnamed protein product [Mytilus edulis]|uniref:Uncharacterized protein n=1 Tax=Mytilus edulis TaxID=6550 RepID=A0A8S3S699_MYTED|nr:unnamed protein product [Mytilus edulis]